MKLTKRQTKIIVVSFFLVILIISTYFITIKSISKCEEKKEIPIQPNPHEDIPDKDGNDPTNPLPQNPPPVSNRWLETEDIEKTYQDIRSESSSEILLFDVSLAHTIKLIEDYVNSQTGSGGDELKKSVEEWKKAKLIFLPVNNSQTEEGGGHWSLLVYRGENKFYHCDSMENSNFPSAKALAGNFLKTLKVNEAPNIQTVPCPQQPNGYDCGVYTIIFTRVLVEKYKSNPAAITNDDFWKIVEKDFKFSVSEERKKIGK